MSARGPRAMESARVVEGDPERRALTSSDEAHAVAHGHPPPAAPAPDRPVARREDDGLALGERDRRADRLLARSLLDEEELAAREAGAGAGEHHRHLQRE